MNAEPPVEATSCEAALYFPEASHRSLLSVIIAVFQKSIIHQGESHAYILCRQGTAR